MVKLGEISAIDRWLEMSRMQELVEALGGGADDIAQKDRGEQCQEKPGYAGFESDKSQIKF
ncbi:hypothetical protein BFN10_05200 [Pseudomonas extremorientalis]|jgi:hypothetical protein|uniref:Uncharacterized protein n=1 Tax=Pseudomonas extremorientalis TaxID=169669 RepID=A0A1H0VGJ7_9PSED|nr:hypothetical protein BFN10_05200 [Pseudomonas extremorientalis]SDP77338.1 hypothetical protein SAMN04490184_4808 [Pseudomonas extremorientalis]